jgi:endosialidase-like protein
MNLFRLKRAFLLLIPLVLACFALLPRAQGQVTPELLPAPPPDGAYAGFNTAEGLNALFNLSSGQFNTALGFASLKADSSGSHNTAVGGQALLHNTTGSFNTAIGENSLTFNTTGSMNMALGQGALARNNADDSTAMGFQALNRNTTGEENTAVGIQALFSNTGGYGNTAIGSRALSRNNGSFDTITGNYTGSYNTATGDIALFGNTTGSNNTASGADALFGNTTGSNNIALGAFAGDNLTTGSNNIDIDNEGIVGESNTTRIGSVQTRTFIAGIRGRATGVANAIPVLIDSSGQLGTASSSRRFKKQIKPMDQTSEAILGLKPVTFHYKSDSTGTLQFGLIAEEVAAVNPDLVVRDENGEIYTVRYDAVNAMLLNEFLKEHRTVEQQDRRLEQQERTIAKQQKQIDALTAGLQKVSAQLEGAKSAPQIVLNNQ